MTHVWQADLTSADLSAVTFPPPPLVEETGWDILLALHSDRQRDLSLQKLASLVSTPEAVMDRWLATLEQRGLLIAAEHRSTGEILAVLTRRGRELLDRYFSAASELQIGAQQ